MTSSAADAAALAIMARLWPGQVSSLRRMQSGMGSASRSGDGSGGRFLMRGMVFVRGPSVNAPAKSVATHGSRRVCLRRPPATEHTMAAAPKQSLSVTDNRTGKTYELAVTDDTIRAMDLRQIRVNPGD